MKKLIKITQNKITIPQEMVKEMELDKEQALLIENIENDIILSKISQRCVFCEKEETRNERLKSFSGKLICSDCINKIKEVL